MLRINSSKNWIAEFSEIFFKQIVPMEAHLTFLVGKKDYNFHRDVIKIFQEGLKQQDEFQSLIETQLLPLQAILAKNYLWALFDKFLKDFEETEQKNLLYLAKSGSIYDINTAIEKIESTYGFSLTEKAVELYENKVSSGDYDPESFSKESLQNLQKVFNDYFTAQNLLLNTFNESISNNVDFKSRVKHVFQKIFCKNALPCKDDEDYIQIVVYSEFWNFLSHYTFANTYRTTPDNFKQNIDRATRHLERAILDIYKYIIIKNKLVSSNVLNIRVEELLSFGNSVKLNYTYNSYQDSIK